MLCIYKYITNLKSSSNYNICDPKSPICIFHPRNMNLNKKFVTLLIQKKWKHQTQAWPPPSQVQPPLPERTSPSC
ncbi:uncharacterized protein DS421_4g123100 [Arachis hypogaea]|nr:uncharacterized protein DS421_4g123100 [Arachis hypogaea]